MTQPPWSPECQDGCQGSTTVAVIAVVLLLLVLVLQFADDWHAHIHMCTAKNCRLCKRDAWNIERTRKVCRWCGR